MKKERVLVILAKALIITLILLFLLEMGSIYAQIWSINNHLTKIESDLSAMETQLAPDGPIDHSLDELDKLLGTPTPVPIP